MGDGPEFKVRITGDASSLQQAGRESEAALGGVTKETKKGSEAVKESGRAAEESGISHRALHRLLHEVGQGSQEAEFALTALSGVMMGSTMFGVMALGEGIRMLTEHFQKVKEAALEQAHVMTTMWIAGLDQAADARKAALDYAEALEKMTRGHDTLQEKQAEGEALLKNELQLRKELLETKMQAELAQAKGDKDEQERIRQRYGHQKQEMDLQGQMIELLHERRVLDERGAEAETKKAAYDEAVRQQTSMGAAFRGEADVAAEWMANHKKELEGAENARMKPEELEALRQVVARRAGEPGWEAGPYGGMQLSQAGIARRGLAAAEKAEDAYSALHQEWEHNRDTVETYKASVARVEKTVGETNKALEEANTAQEAARAEVHKLEALYQQNRDALIERQRIEAIPVIKQAGFAPSPLTQNVMASIWALVGTAQGERMSGSQTEMANALLRGIETIQHARGQSDRAVTELINKLISEIRDPHVELARKLQDVMVTLQQSQTRLLPGSG